jgi:hypothetical protein
MPHGLAGYISKSNAHKLGQGAVLFFPSQDTVVKTKTASVKIAGGSVVLVMGLHEGVAVYDLHDRQKGAVEISSAENTISLYPGRFALVSAAPGKDFAELNPAQAIGYRDLEKHSLAPGLLAYSGDFCLQHAMQAVEPLKKVMLSQNRLCKLFAHHLLKTAAIISQLKGDDNFQQMMPPLKTASLD